MSLETALAKLAEAREQVHLLVQERHIKSPEFKQAYEDYKEAIQQVKREVTPNA